MTTIKSTQNVSSKDNLILIGTAKSDFAKQGLSKAEADFVNKQIKAEEHIININQYERRILIYIAEDKKNENYTLEAFRKAGNKACGVFNAAKAEQVTLVDLTGNAEQILAFAEGMALGNYQFIQLKKDAKKLAHSLKTILIHSKKVTAKEIQNLQIVVDATEKARTLVNLPLNYLNAVQLAKEFEKMGKEAGFKVEVLNKARIEALKMGGLIAVNLGSIDPPTFTIMEYKPKNAVNKKPYMLVGKGVVYDTGGLSLKPTAGMADMKCDMGGAATVGCTMYAIAKAGLPVWVVGLTPATDNRPGGNAYTNGDILTMHDGSTVEMLNADAEGRLILADALSYGKKYNPELAIDLATLTGAAAAAIGKYGIVAMGTAGKNEFDALKHSGEKVNERLVEFPMWEEYGDLLKTEIADMKNIGGPVAGAITAGKFLEKFTSYPWIHLDIAGPAFLDSAYDYKTKGGTGVGVRLLFDFLSNVKK
ncbi:MAG TPA: leucyl aminopeptidase [Bacteroidia bacterium]|jgi:leucyl aminopeptidase|nr:leucyl aminopeptidase [Bacteroidia bacterium]